MNKQLKQFVIQLSMLVHLVSLSFVRSPSSQDGNWGAESFKSPIDGITSLKTQAVCRGKSSGSLSMTEKYVK